MLSGYSCSQIARKVRTSAATVRREIDRALAERRLDAPERFAQVQVSRLAKALRLAEAAVELGELKAVVIYLRIVAALDRYHELAAGTPPPRRPARAPFALPALPKALTFATPADKESSPVEDARSVGEGGSASTASRSSRSSAVDLIGVAEKET